MAKAKQKSGGVPVSERALVQRINRCLAKEHGTVGSPPMQAVQLRKARGQHALRNLGEFYTIAVHRNAIVDSFDTKGLEKYGREVGALSGWERLVKEDER